MIKNVCSAVYIKYDVAGITVRPYLTPIIFDTISPLSMVSISEGYLHLIKRDSSGFA